MSDPLDPIHRALRAERETSPWWNQHAEPRPPHEPTAVPHDGPLWDDSDVATARRRRLLREASSRMGHREASA
jgi:hypothetical protein